MIRDICFKTSEHLSLESVAGREYIGLVAADLDLDGSPEMIAYALNGDIVVYKDCTACLSLEGLGTSSICAFQVLENFRSKYSPSGCTTALAQLYSNGTLSITTVKAAARREGGEPASPPIEVHHLTSTCSFPRNATNLKSFLLPDGDRILIISSCSEFYVYKYNEVAERFDPIVAKAVESDVNSIDFIDGHFLMFGLRGGGIIIYDFYFEAKPVSVVGSMEDGARVASPREGDAADGPGLVLRRVRVQAGREPPLSRLKLSAAQAECFLKGYLSAVVTDPSEGVRGPLLAAHSSDSLDTQQQTPLPAHTVHFAAAWADGRICLCDIVVAVGEELDQVSPEEGQDEEVSLKYVWKAVRCVQTGLCLFSIDCIHLQKHVEYDSRSAVVSADDVLCIVVARTGQTFFVSSTDYSDYKKAEGSCAHENGTLPRTVCCFESSILLGRSNNANPSRAVVSEDTVREVFSNGSHVMIRSFTTNFRVQDRHVSIAVATTVDEVAPASKVAASITVGDDSCNSQGNGSYATSDFSTLLDGSSSAISASVAVTEVVNIGSGLSLGQISATEDDRGDDGTAASAEPASIALAEAEIVEQIQSVPQDIALSLWYLTGDGKLICIPNVDSQFLSFGAGLTSTRVEGRDIDFIKDTLIQWMLAPESVTFDFGEELMDLVFEYFHPLAQVLASGVKSGASELKKVVNNKTVAEHMTLYFLHELSLLPPRDIINFTKDLRDLVDNYC